MQIVLKKLMTENMGVGGGGGLINFYMYMCHTIILNILPFKILAIYSLYGTLYIYSYRVVEEVRDIAIILCINREHMIVVKV